MKQRTILATFLLLSACSTLHKSEPTKDALWRVVDEPTTAPTENTGSLLDERRAAGRSIVISNRLAAPVRTASLKVAAKPKAAPALAAVLPAAELQKADSLLTTLQAQNKVADTLEQRTLAADKPKVLRPRRAKQAPHAFEFKPTNIRPTDTVFIDSKGVKLALWIGPNGIEQKVAKGAVVSKTSGDETTDVTVEVGFDWQPYRVSLLVIGCFTALALLFGLGTSLFHPSNVKKHERLV